MELKLAVKTPTDTITHITVKVDYHKAGHNWFNGKQERGGVFCYVTPVKLEGGFKSFKLGAGAKVLLEELNRKSAKKIAAGWTLAQQMVAGRWGKVWECVQLVCQEAGVEIADEAEAKA